MKVLFVPCHTGGVAHQIPLLALDQMVRDSSIETAFLLPASFHRMLKQAGARVLPVDHNSFRTEMLAYSKFMPDVVVDDLSYFTGFATGLEKLPHVSIQRTGIFLGGIPRNKSHTHSSGFDLEKVRDVTSMGLRQPRTYGDLFSADLKIVPGIRTIEMLPENLRDDPTYYYCGPLLWDDYLMQTSDLADFNSTKLDNFRDFESLHRFFESNRGRKVVYATFGTVASAGDEVVNCIKYLFDRDVAVVTNIGADRLAGHRQEIYYYARYLPMNFVCSRVDLAIHHCGCGTYHYPILHNLPSVTIGTMCYDRDDIALRLQELGVSEHVPAPGECEDFVERFKRAVEKYLDGPESRIQQVKARLAALNEEIERTASSFIFEQVLYRAVELKGRSFDAHG